jgi:methylenetetrahydrofolate reductase (NADPH)
LKEKIDAGADFIITQFFYDVDAFLRYVRKCREIGISCPIIPGIMPIQSYGTLLKMTKYCNVYVPKSMLDRLERSNKNDDDSMKQLGCEVAAEMCVRIFNESGGDVDGIHFYTLNLERSVTDIMGKVQQCAAAIASIESTKSEFKVLSPKRPKEEVRYD